MSGTECRFVNPQNNYDESHHVHQATITSASVLHGEDGYSHINRHVGFGDCPWGTYQGRFENDFRCNFRVECHGGSREINEPRKNKKVIVSQSAMEFRVHEFSSGETIRGEFFRSSSFYSFTVEGRRRGRDIAIDAIRLRSDHLL
jgi:hypothetical protein